MRASGVIEHAFAPDYPAAQGHFPENPIVPGAVLLSEIWASVAEELGGVPALTRVTSAKFRQPVRPGDRVLVRFATTGNGVVSVVGSVNGANVLTATVLCGAPPG